MSTRIGPAFQRGRRVIQLHGPRSIVPARREGERLITQGRVSVDGTIVTELGTQVVLGEQVVHVDGKLVELRPVRWIAMYKPSGYLTTRKDDRDRPTVYSLLPDGFGELFYVGRLDRLTEGLLIFTNEGETAHRLLHPSNRIPRRYRAEVKGLAGVVEARRLERGVALEDGLARAEDVRVTTKSPSRQRSGAQITEIHLTLREGRKREVRRMLDALDLRTMRLIRLSFGPIELGSLKPGEWRQLTAEEVNALRAVVGTRDSDGDT